MHKKNILNSNSIIELRRRRRNSLKKKLFLFLFIILIVFYLVVLFTKWDKVQIKNIEVSGVKIINNSSIKKNTLDFLSNKTFIFFNKDNFLFLSKKNLEAELKNKFTRIENIKISLKGLNTLVILIEEKKPNYVWCGEEIPGNYNEIRNKKCLFLDKNGVIFDNAPSFSSGVYVKMFGPVEKIKESESLFNSYFKKDYFSDIINIVDYLEYLELKPSFLFVKEDKEIEVYLNNGFELGKIPKIIFSLNKDILLQLSNLETSLFNDPLKEELKANNSHFLYIDLRFDNKIFYKIK